jgi:hypothetical protein
MAKRNQRATRCKQRPTANQLTKAVVKYINYQKNCLAFRVNSTGIYDAKLGIWRKSNTIKGIADISVIAHGHSLWIEIKVGKDRQSDAQKAFQSKVEKADGNYWLVREFKDFEARWQTFITHLKNEQENGRIQHIQIEKTSIS